MWDTDVEHALTPRKLDRTVEIAEVEKDAALFLRRMSSIFLNSDINSNVSAHDVAVRNRVVDVTVLGVDRAVAALHVLRSSGEPLVASILLVDVSGLASNDVDAFVVVLVDGTNFLSALFHGSKLTLRSCLIGNVRLAQINGAFHQGGSIVQGSCPLETTNMRYAITYSAGGPW